MSGRLGIDTRSSLAQHVSALGPLPSLHPRRGGHPGVLVDEVEAAGLRGRGGGWFPTATKLRAVVSSSHGGRLSRGRPPVVIANGMEGEPASGKDAVLLDRSPHLVLDGVSAAVQAVGATDAFLAIHRDSPLVDHLLIALEDRARAGIDPVEIKLVTPPARYVASEESALSHWVGAGTATPVYPDRPFQRGADGRPTLVQNVETLAHLALIARFGGAWYREVGAPTAPGTTLLTVGGSVRHAGVVEVPTGTPVGDVLAACGGTTEPIRGFLTGGYGGAWVAAPGFDTVGWEPDAVRGAGGVIGASVLWALGASVCPLDELARVATWMAGESAGQCGPCILGLPSVADDVHRLAVRAADGADMERLKRRLTLVTGRGGCKHPDGTARFVSTGLAAFEDEVRLHLDRRCSTAGLGSAADARELPTPTPRLALVDVSGRDFE
jgi:NADH:ubiquinone oxidoreductase subunit F (NADH-binding)